MLTSLRMTTARSYIIGGSSSNNIGISNIRSSSMRNYCIGKRIRGDIEGYMYLLSANTSSSLITVIVV